MRRWAKGLAIALGVLALFAVWMIGGAAWITARPGRSDALAAARRAHRRGLRHQQRLSRGAGAAARAACRVRERARLSGADRRHAALRGLRLDRVRLGRTRVLPVGADRRRHRPARSRCARCSIPDNTTVRARRRHQRRSGAGLQGRHDEGAALAERLRPDAGRSSMRRSCRRRTARCRISAAASTDRACSIRRTARSASRACAITGSAICLARPACRPIRCSRRFRPGCCSICAGAQAFSTVKALS